MARFQTCPKCRALLEPGTKRCPYCETDQGAALAMSVDQDARATGNLGLWLIGACAVLYVLMVVLDPARGDNHESPYEPTQTGMTVFGIHHPVWVQHCGQWWRLVTANFVHLDVPHLLMNGVALFFVLSLAGATFGVHRTWVIYLVTGVLSVLASDLARQAGGGASGAICGMIGALGVYGWRRGGFEGRMLTRRMMGWALFIFAFGLFMPNVDNLAHGAGFVAGAVVGWFGAAVRARGGRADRAWKWLAHGCTALVVVVAVGFLLPNVLRGRERSDVAWFDSQVERALKVARGAGDVVFRGTLEPGPGESAALAEAVNRALRLARDEAPREQVVAAVRRAEDAWSAWRRRIHCSHQMRFS